MAQLTWPSLGGAGAAPYVESVPRLGLCLNHRLQRGGSDELTRVIRAAHDSGFTSLWSVEGRSMDAFALLASISSLAPTCDLGTAIAPISTRPPTLAAMAATTLQTFNSDRAIYLGLGVSSRFIVEGWHGRDYPVSPLRAVREYVEIVRRCLAGETVTRDGEFFRVDGFRLDVRNLETRRPLIALAALNTGMLRVAGDVADAVILNSVAPSHIAPSRAVVLEAGRPVEVMGFVHVGVGDRESVSGRLRFSVVAEIAEPGYARLLTAMGYGRPVARALAAMQTGDVAAATAALPEELITQLFGVGDPQTVTNYVRDVCAAGLDNVIVFPEVDDLDQLPATLAAARAGLDAVGV